MTTRAPSVPRRPSTAKQHGVHYTPPGLARAVASRLAAQVTAAGLTRAPAVVADPACGSGELLEALAFALRERGIDVPLAIHAVDRDPAAVAAASARRKACADVFPAEIRATASDFLSSLARAGQLALDAPAPLPPVDVLIANPPYVRTQVLGAAAAQALKIRPPTARSR